MPSPDEIGAAARDAATQYGQEQEALGAASRQPELDALAAQERADIATNAVLRAQLAALEEQLAAKENEPPTDYKVPNSADQIQAMTASTKVFLPTRTDGTKWVLPAKLLVEDGFDILASPDAVMVKAFKAPNAVGACLFANRKYDLANPVQDFRLRGGTIEVLPGMGGGIWGQYANQDMRDVHVAGWSSGPLFGGGGPGPDSMYFENITAEPVAYDYTKDVKQPAGSGCAGWRPKCGGGKMVNSHIHSGDDSLQLVPAGATEDPMFNGPDLEFWYIDCTGDSNTARSLGCGMQTGNELPDGDTSAGMRINVRGGWLRCKGTCSGSCVNIANHHGLGMIDGVQAIGCEVWQDDRLGTRGQPGEVNVITYNGLTVPLGLVQNVRLDVIIHSARVPKPKKLVNASGPLGLGIDTSAVRLAA